MGLSLGFRTLELQIKGISPFLFYLFCSFLFSRQASYHFGNIETHLFVSRVFNLSSFFFSGASLMAQMVKSLPATWETWVWSLGWEDPLEKGMATHSSICAWRILWTEESGGLQSMGSQRVGWNWATNTFTFPFLGVNLKFSCLEFQIALHQKHCVPRWRSTLFSFWSFGPARDHIHGVHYFLTLSQAPQMWRPTDLWEPEN